MPTWISIILKFALGPFGEPLRAIANAINTLWSIVTGFFASCRTVFTTLRTRAQAWIAAQLAHAAAVLTTLKWIITTYVPRIGAAIAAQIRAWTSDLVNAAENLARALVDQAKRAFTALINDVKAAATAFASWVRQQVGNLLTAVTLLAQRVFGLLGTPERLALWAVDAIMHAGLRWVTAHLEAIVAYVWARRRPYYSQFAHLTEDLFSKLL